MTGPLRPPLLLAATVLPGGMTAPESLGAPDRPSLGVAAALDAEADGVADADADGGGHDRFDEHPPPGQVLARREGLRAPVKSW